MTDEQARELGRWALAEGLHAMAGMLLRPDDPGALHSTPTWAAPMMVRLSELDSDGTDKWPASWPWPGRLEGWWPDFRDAATLGTLMAQVRERWGDWDGLIYVTPPCRGGGAVRRGWQVWAPNGQILRLLPDREWTENLAGFASEAEAWVAALEARPLAPAGKDE